MRHEATSWAVVCDFDGTISRADATDALLTAHATEEWHAIEARWERGEIGSRECLSLQLECVQASSAEIDALADGIEIDPDFIPFSRYCQSREIPLTIVSDGMEQIIRRILVRHGLGHLRVVANRLIPGPFGTYALGSPNARPDCLSGTCKCAVMRGLRADDPMPRRLLFFGDGRSDFCAAARAADVVAAKSGLLSDMLSLGLPVIDCPSFADAPTILARLLDGQGSPVLNPEGILHERA